MNEIQPIHILSIAGSDSGGGAGVQADWRTFAAMGLHGCTAITAITAQNSTAVWSIHPLPVEVVRAQIDAVFSDFSIKAVKTGMLPTVEIICLVASIMESRPDIPLVVDPVLSATTGSDLQEAGCLKAIRDKLLPLATLITPNASEASLLSGLTVEGADDFDGAARTLLDTGCAWVLITGGDLPGDRAWDQLASINETFAFSERKVDTPHTHGSGCTLASAAASRIALGEDIPTAVRNAKCFITEAIHHPIRAGKGRGPIHALHRLTPWQPSE